MERKSHKSERGRTRDAREGAVLGLAMVVLLVVGLLGTGLLTLSSTNAVEVSRLLNRTQAFWNAEAGLAELQAWAAKYPVPLESAHGFSLSWSASMPRGSYAVVVTPDPGNPGARIKGYTVTSTGTGPDGQTRALSIRAEIETFASFMHASNYERTPWGGRIYFGTDDIMDGKIYVNDQINIWGTPAFLEMARSAAATVNYQNGGDVSVFQGGLMLNQPALDFGEYVDHVDNVRADAQSGGIALDGNHQIRFYEDGTIVYWTPGSDDRTTNTISSFNGAVYVNGSCRVQGVLDGRVTVAAENIIQIAEGGLVYESAQSPDPWEPGFDPADVDDALGLVARYQVVVLGDSDIDIHAAVLVTDDAPFSFTYAWGFHADNKFDYIGTPYINLYGSISQYRRGVVGRTNGQGFSKNYKYDTRFLVDPPSFFPYSSYEITQWEQL